MSQETYVMPWVELGMTVRWHPGGGTDWVPAIVTNINGGDNRKLHLNLNVMYANRASFQIRDAVRHVSDPATTTEDRAGSGLWSHLDFTNRILAMEKKIDELFGEPAKPKEVTGGKDKP